MIQAWDPTIHGTGWAGVSRTTLAADEAQRIETAGRNSCHVSETVSTPNCFGRPSRIQFAISDLTGLPREGAGAAKLPVLHVGPALQYALAWESATPGLPATEKSL